MKTENHKKTDRQRQGLLAKVHIAIKELCLKDDTYRQILADEFGVGSSAFLGKKELERLVKLFESWGWKPRKKRETKESQLASLRERIYAVARSMSLERNRLRGMCQLICQVDDPAWSRDNKKLIQLLAALENLRRRERNE